MIVDRIECAGMYGALGEPIAAGLALLQEEHVINAAPGRYEVQGEDLYFVADSYMTRTFEVSRFESHRKYLDIQYLVSGREWIGCCPVESLIVDVKYDPGRDVEFYKPSPQMSRILMEPGVFSLFFPHDAHMPGMMIDSPERVKKIVVKIRIE